jgi:hypothetical protein
VKLSYPRIEWSHRNDLPWTLFHLRNQNRSQNVKKISFPTADDWRMTAHRLFECTSNWWPDLRRFHCCCREARPSITIYQTKWDYFLTAMLLRIKFSWFGRYSWFSIICDELFDDCQFRNNCRFRYYPVILIKMGYFEISFFFEITELFRNNRRLSKKFLISK